MAKLNAIRYDLDGNGIPDSSAGVSAYRTAFPDTVPLGLVSGCPSTCIGYELRKSLNFDTDGDGTTWTGTKANPTSDSADTYHNSGKGWTPLGDYTATFEGNGYTIDNLFINRGSSDNGAAGLFKTISATGIVRNLGVRNILVRTQGATGGNAGGIASVNSGTIQTSFVTGSTFGFNSGLVVANNPGTITHSYATGSVSVSGDGSAAGGIAGNSGVSAGTIKNSWTAATVTKTGTGGGKNGIATAGTITTSYFDTDEYGATGTNGKTTVQLKSPTGYTGTIYSTWDDDNIDGVTGADAPWNFGTATEYPILTFGGHSSATQTQTQQSTVIVAPGNAQATINWMTEDILGITGWQFIYKTQDAGTWPATWTDVPSSIASTTSHTITSLTNGTTYFFKVRAKKSGGGNGPESEVAVATPNTTIPATDFDSNDNNLIEITTLAQLDAMRYDLDGDGVPSGAVATKIKYSTAFNTSQAGFFCDACIGYELMNELDFDTDDDGSTWTVVNGEPTGDSDDTYYNDRAGWLPIGSSASQFSATFDGNGHLIKNLFINRATDDIGLFGVIDASAVLTEITLFDAAVIGQRYTGSLVGLNYGMVRASYVNGGVNGRVTGTRDVGGLLGVNSGTLSTSFSAITVSGADSLGGLIGTNTLSGRVINTYSIGSVSGTGSANYIGGLIGVVSGAASTVTGSYWDTDTSGRGATARTGEKGGTGKTTLQLQSPTGYDSDTGNSGTAIYSAWDESDIDGDGDPDAPWDFGTASEYPTINFGGQRGGASRLNISGIIATPGNAQVTLSWASESAVATGFDFAYKTKDAQNWGDWTRVPDSTAHTRSHTISSLTNGTTYLFKVRIKLNNTVGSVSEETLATPGASIPVIDFDSNDNNLIDITTLAQLNAIRYDLDGDGISSGPVEGKILYHTAFRTSQAGFFCDACAGYELMNSLDFDGGAPGPRADDAYHNSWSGWEPIGTNTNPFATTFDGNGYVLSNLYINRTLTLMIISGSLVLPALLRHSLELRSGMLR